MKLVIPLLLAVAPFRARAQSVPPARGPEFSVGIGVGSLGTACDSCATGGARQSGLALHLWVGAPVAAKLLVGVDIVRWDTPQGASAAALTSLTASAYFYPSSKSDWFVSGGVGLSNYDNSVALPALGLGLEVGTGIEIPVARNFALTPAARLLWGTARDVHTNEQLLVARGLQPDLFAVDLSASFRFRAH